VDEQADSNGRPCGPSHQGSTPVASQLTGVGVGLRTRATEDAFALPLSYARTGRRDSNPCHEGTPDFATGRLRLSRSTTTAGHRLAARPGLEPGPPVSKTGVVPLPPPRSARVRAGLDGEIRTPNLRLPKPARSRCATSSRTDGGIRTRTDGGLSAVPLPLGYVSVCCTAVDRAGFEPATFSLQGSCASGCATGPDLCAVRWSRGRESNPRAGRMRPRCTQCPRSVTGRTRTDFLRGHVPASRPLQTSATVDEEGVEPPASCV
jgi:hypothetical protein